MYGTTDHRDPNSNPNSNPNPSPNSNPSPNPDHNSAMPYIDVKFKNENNIFNFS